MILKVDVALTPQNVDSDPSNFYNVFQVFSLLSYKSFSHKGVIPMKRIMLLLLITLFIPICSQAISYHELFGTPGKNFFLRTVTDGVMITGESPQNMSLKVDDKTVVLSSNVYFILIDFPELIMDLKIRATYNVRPGESIMNMQYRIPDEFELLDLKVYYSDGTYLPKKTAVCTAYVKKLLNQYYKKIKSAHREIKDSTKYSYSGSSNN